MNALNALVGSVETAGGILFTPTANLGTDTSFARTGEFGLSPQILFLDGANPVYLSPKARKMRETIAQVPYIVSFGNFIDETSVMADLILPDHSFLESWVQAAPESGAKTAVSTVAGPVMRPLHDTRSTPDVLLDVGSAVGQAAESAVEDIRRNAEGAGVESDRK